MVIKISRTYLYKIYTKISLLHSVQVLPDDIKYDVVTSDVKPNPVLHIAGHNGFLSSKR